MSWKSPAGCPVRGRSTRQGSPSQRAIAAMRYEITPLGEPSRQRSRPAVHDQVIAVLGASQHAGWEGLTTEQRDYLDEFWEGAAGDTEGDAELQQAVFFFQAEDGIRDLTVTGVQTCALPI